MGIGRKDSFEEEFKSTYREGMCCESPVNIFRSEEDEPIYQVLLLEIGDRKTRVKDLAGNIEGFWNMEPIFEPGTKEIEKAESPGEYWLENGMIDTFFTINKEVTRELALNKIGI
jgi:hypothetical protein